MATAFVVGDDHDQVLREGSDRQQQQRDAPGRPDQRVVLGLDGIGDHRDDDQPRDQPQEERQDCVVEDQPLIVTPDDDGVRGRERHGDHRDDTDGEPVHPGHPVVERVDHRHDGGDDDGGAAEDQPTDGGADVVAHYFFSLVRVRSFGRSKRSIYISLIENKVNTCYAVTDENSDNNFVSGNV